MNKIVYHSLLISVIFQIITGLIEASALFFTVSPKYEILKQLMLLEVIVQFVEGSFYTYWLYNFKRISNITPSRYFDWSITTPTMLINLIFYLIFLQANTNLDFFSVFKQEFSTIIVVLVLNWLMLLLGYLGEISKIPVNIGVPLGFVPFILYFYIIYEKYAITTEGLQIFYYFFIFWSLYGVAALMPYKIKSVCYNILDLFSKNFFGIFLFYLLYTKQQ